MLDGAQQDVNVEIIDSESDVTTVELVGVVSTPAKKLLAKAQIKQGELTLALMKTGVSLMVTSDDKEPLTLRITTNLEQPFELLDIDMLAGQVTIVVPDAYQGSYEAKISQGQGKVLAVPETTEKMNSLIRVSSSEDIKISK